MIAEAEQVPRVTVALRTPEQVADDLGLDPEGRHIVSPITLRRMVREGTASCTRLSRGRVAFTESQVADLLASLASPAAGAGAVVAGGFKPTRARRAG